MQCICLPYWIEGRHLCVYCQSTLYTQTYTHYAHIQAHIQAHIYAHSHTYKHTCKHTYMHIRTHTSTYTNTHTRTCAHIQAHIQTHTRSSIRKNEREGLAVPILGQVGQLVDYDNGAQLSAWISHVVQWRNVYGLEICSARGQRVRNTRLLNEAPTMRQWTWKSKSLLVL